MNADLLRKAADRLDLLLAANAATHPDIAVLRQKLQAVIVDSKAGRLAQIIEIADLPGNRMFSDGQLRSVPELDKAYGQFAYQISGGDTDERLEIRKRMGAIRKGCVSST